MLTRLEMTEKYTVTTVADQVMELSHAQTKNQIRFKMRLAGMNLILHPVKRKVQWPLCDQLFWHIRESQ